VFDETFATISKSSLYDSHCVHEAINGRKAENLTDAIVRIIDIERDQIIAVPKIRIVFSFQHWSIL